MNRARRSHWRTLIRTATGAKVLPLQVYDTSVAALELVAEWGFATHVKVEGPTYDEKLTITGWIPGYTTQESPQWVITLQQSEAALRAKLFYASYRLQSVMSQLHDANPSERDNLTSEHLFLQRKIEHLQNRIDGKPIETCPDCRG